MLPSTPRAPRRALAAAAATAALALTVTGLGAPAPATSAVGRPVSPTTLPGGLSLATASIADIQAGLRAGTFTSVDLVKAYLARIDAISYAGPRLNAVRQVAGDALAQAEAADAARRAGRASGPLAGIPILVKDNIDVAGMPTTAGSVSLANSFPKGDATLTTSLEAAGAIILGKLNLTEFANFLTNGMPAGYSSLGGQVLNAYDLSQTPSGSSAGSGVAASTAMAAATVGTETSGSILSPAGANALVGIKPTVGLISRTGVIPISATQDTAGPMTRYVGDAAALLSGMTTGADPEDTATQDGRAATFKGVDYTASLSTTALQGVRLGFVPATGNDQAAIDTYNAGLQALRDQGATLVQVTAPVAPTTVPGPSLLVREFRRDLNAYLSRLPATAPVKTLADVIAYNDAHADVALKFGQVLATQSQAVDLSDPATNASYQALRTESVNGARTAIDATLTSNNISAIVSNNGTTGIGARAGYPSLTMPAGFSPANRRPVPIAFLGTAYTEQKLISYASDLEAATKVWRSPEALNPTAFACTPLAVPNAAQTCDTPAERARVRTTVVANAVRNPVRLGEKAKLRVVVVAGATKPSGKVVVRQGGKKVGSARLGDSGRAVVKVRTTTVGLRTLKVIYQGDAVTYRDTAKVFLRVLRR